MGRSDRPRRALVASVIAAVIAASLSAVAAPTFAATAPCKVVNARTGASGADLQAAITGARAKDVLKVTGTCKGAFTVGRSLSIVKGAKAATLKGTGTAPVLRIAAGKVKLTGLTITGGKAGRCPIYSGTCGGGILAKGKGTVVTLTAVVVKGNTATASDGVTGGAGIANARPATLKLIRSAVTGNTVTGPAAHGAGIMNSGVLRVTRSTVKGNTATGTDYAVGGGIYLGSASASVTIARSTIADNVVDSDSTCAGGGVMAEAIVSPVVRQSTVSGNDAACQRANGGGIYTIGAITLTDSTVSGNHSAMQYGAMSVNGTAALRGVTITANTAPSGSGAAFFSTGTTVMGSIIAGNVSATTTFSVDCTQATGAVTYVDTLVGSKGGCEITDGQDGNLAGTDGDELDPKLGALAANGGPTRTHALQPDSPAINAAGTGSDTCSTTDQRGVARPQGPACDMGAFELQPG